MTFLFAATASLLSFVDPFIGTGATGHCTPAATVPLGAIQAGPDTGNACDWAHCSGYQFSDTLLQGFSSTHLSGTGCGDLGDVRLLPFVEAVPTGPVEMDKSDECASPGYYAVTLKDGIRCEMTASDHAGVFRFVYPEGCARMLIVDLQDALAVFARPETRVLSCTAQAEKRVVSAALDVSCWTRRKLFAEVRFSEAAMTITALEKRHPSEKAPRYVLNFGTASAGENALVVVTGLSANKAVGAKHAADEAHDFDFARVKREAEAKWDVVLSRVTVTGDERTKKLVATALYHLFSGAHLVSDPGEPKLYSELSLWDTYRAAHPFFSLAYPELVDGFAQSLMARYRATGTLPVWPLKDSETNCMIGTPGVSVLADAVLKGLTSVTVADAYEAAAKSLLTRKPRSRFDLVPEVGYVPFDRVSSESVSQTLEGCVHAKGVERLAARLGLEKHDSYSSAYTNLFDSKTGFFRAKDAKGNWRAPFDPMRLAHDASVGGDYTEANAWQYLWHVQHDVDGLATLLGGREAALKKLEDFFKLQLPGNEKLADVTGLIGLYAHGNEPSHHVAYLFALWGRPERTQELVRELTGKKFYDVTPEGLCGNEDCGQMSAWYLFSVLGFYPVDPSSGEYVLGAPQVDEARIGGLTIRRVGTGDYVRSVTFDGVAITEPVISHRRLAAGGELVFTMETKRERMRRLCADAAVTRAVSGDFVKTGDIDAMWLRDSSAQLEDSDDLPLVRAVLARQFAMIRLDPYANAFRDDANPSVWASDLTEMKPGVHERKWELDSLCYPLRLAYRYWKKSGDDSFFDASWRETIDIILAVFTEQQRKGGTKTSYKFQRVTHVPTDTLTNYGYGWPAKPCGLIASAFRPSDDATTYPFHVPSNFFAADVLRKTAEILRAVSADDARADRCIALADEIRDALAREAIVDHPKYGLIYAYEVDGFGNRLLMDDANVPSLLALPLISDVSVDDPVYLNTRRFVWSDDNPYFFRGSAGEGIGSPHTGLDRIWPMSLIVKGMTTRDSKEIEDLLETLERTDASTSLMHESFAADDPTDFTRPWFAWANALYLKLSK